MRVCVYVCVCVCVCVCAYTRARIDKHLGMRRFRRKSLYGCTILIPPCWPSGKASASRAEGPGFESRLRWDFFGVESYQ